MGCLPAMLVDSIEMSKSSTSLHRLTVTILITETYPKTEE